MWCSAAFALLLPGGFALGAGDARRGSQLFGQCMACHSVQPGEHQTGPSLAHVWNRKAGTIPDFMRYSDPVQQSGITWNAAALDKWLPYPAQLHSGNTMTLPRVQAARVPQ